MSGQVITMLPLSAILTPPRVMARCQVDPQTVADYAEAVRGGAELPPVVVYEVSSKVYWLTSGRHRLEAHRAGGLRLIACAVRAGSEDDAVLHAAATNKAHGLPRTLMDKRRAVTLCLTCPAAAGWPAARVARHCGVSEALVGAVKRSLAAGGAPPAPPAAPAQRLRSWGRGEPPPLQPPPLAPPAPASPSGPARPPEDEEDARVLDARIERLLRKFVRYCQAKGAAPREELERFLAAAPLAPPPAAP